jgi:hypothetical protein
MKYWIKLLQTVNSPMKNIFPVVNIALILIIIALMTLATRTWVAPKYPDRVDVNLIAYKQKTLEPLALTRKAHHARIINSAVQGNLFRKDRKEFSPPPVQVAKVIHKPAPPALPPPNLRLKGVLLLGSKKIALMEGNYPVREGNQAIKKKPLKRKGYPLGSKIGDFELTKIEKTNVTLNNNRGVVLSLNLAQRSGDKVIRKVGNSLVQKSKNFDPGNIKKPAPPRRASKTTVKPPARKPKPVRAPRAFRISGAPTQVQAGFKPHVSGR